MTTAVQQGEIKARATHLQVWEYSEWFVCESCLRQEAELWAGMFLGEPLVVSLCEKCAALLENDLRFIEGFATRIIACAKHETSADRDADITIDVWDGQAEETEGLRFVNVRIINHDNERG